MRRKMVVSFLQIMIHGEMQVSASFSKIIGLILVHNVETYNLSFQSLPVKYQVKSKNIF